MGKRMRFARSFEDRQTWRGYWAKALANMPKTASWRNPSPTALLILLGYKHGYRGSRPYKSQWMDRLTEAAKTETWAQQRLAYCKHETRTKMYNMSGQHVQMAKDQGTKPKGKRAAILQALAGPHGKTIARAMFVNRGEVDQYYWD